MNFAEFYKYSWFSNMAYVLWDNAKTLDKNAMIRAANSESRVPGDPDSPEPTLGQEIFINQGWNIPSFYQNDAFGFAANVFMCLAAGEDFIFYCLKRAA